ncbi:MAG: prepilin-type N-terminal cleavage/methylation domain-containing protein [Geminicoccaceae bacterium]
MNGDRHARERGFTLVEMIVALVLLGLVLALIGAGARVLRGTGDRLTERGDSLADLALFSTLVQERLGDAVQLDFGPAGLPAAAFDGNAQRVRFLTLAPDFQASEPLLAMEIVADPESGVWLGLAPLAADQKDFGVLDDVALTERRLLLGDVTSMRISYFGRQKDEEAAWHEVWQDEERLPRAVRFDLDHARLRLPPVIVGVRQQVASLGASVVAELFCSEP